MHTIVDGTEVSQEILSKTMNIAEQFFGTQTDPDQILISKEAHQKLISLHPASILCLLEKGDPVSWVVVLPTLKELAEAFLAEKITEAELLEKSEPSSCYEALYVCAVFTVDGYRGKGYARLLCKEAIARIPHIEEPFLCTWPFTEDGEIFRQKLSQDLGREIVVRK